MKQIIYLIGIDGSGKTTLSYNLIKELKLNNIDSKYFYARHFPILLYPIKIFGKKSILKNTDEFKDYTNYKNKKVTFFKKHRVLAYLYGLLWFFDYFVVTWVRFIGILLSKKIIIVDRFFLDVIINISVTINLRIEQVIKYSKIASYFFPKPDYYIFIDIPPKIAFERKNDIQSIIYLKERRKLYLKLQNLFNFKFVDGTETKEQLVKSVLKIINYIPN